MNLARIYVRLRRVYVHLSFVGQMGVYLLVFDRFGWIWLPVFLVVLVPIAYWVHVNDKKYFLPAEQGINTEANQLLYEFLNEWKAKREA